MDAILGTSRGDASFGELEISRDGCDASSVSVDFASLNAGFCITWKWDSGIV